MTEVRVKDVVGKLQYALNNHRVANINQCVRELLNIEREGIIYKPSSFFDLFSKKNLSEQQFESLIKHANQNSKLSMISSLSDSVMANVLNMNATVCRRIGILLNDISNLDFKKRITFDIDGGSPIERLVVLAFPDLPKAKVVYLRLLNNLFANATQFNSMSLYSTLYELDALIEWDPCYENLKMLVSAIHVLLHAEDHLGSKDVDEERMISAYCRAGAILKVKANTCKNQAYQHQCEKLLKRLESRFRMHTRMLYRSDTDAEVLNIVLGQGFNDQIRSLNGITRKMMGFRVFMHDQVVLTRVARSLMNYVMEFWDKVMPGEAYVESFFQVIGAYVDWDLVFTESSPRRRVFIVQHCKDHSRFFHLLNQQERRYALEGDLNL